MDLLKCKLIADVAVFAEGEVLLVKYRDSNKYDHQKGWFLPDDLLREFEHPDEAAKRILHEQLKISNVDIKLFGMESFKGNDKTWHLAFHYILELPKAPDIFASPDIEFYDWIDLNELPDPKEVAHHGWALYTIESMLPKK